MVKRALFVSVDFEWGVSPFATVLVLKGQHFPCQSEATELTAFGLHHPGALACNAPASASARPLRDASATACFCIFGWGVLSAACFLKRTLYGRTQTKEAALGGF
jgi:hypothetical protein